MNDYELQQFLTYRIARLHMKLNAQAKRILKNTCRLGLSEWRVLALIGSKTASSSREITSEASIDPALLSRTIKKLEARGLVTTAKTPEDLRVLALKLTPQGVRVYEETIPHMRSRQRRLQDSLTRFQADEFVKIIDQLETAAGERQ